MKVLIVVMMAMAFVRGLILMIRQYDCEAWILQYLAQLCFFFFHLIKCLWILSIFFTFILLTQYLFDRRFNLFLNFWMYCHFYCWSLIDLSFLEAFLCFSKRGPWLVWWILKIIYFFLFIHQVDSWSIL